MKPPDKDISFFEVNHSNVDEQLFYKDTTDVINLFHGSPSYNWHSILRNGLRNMSHTTRMTSGAAYGNGVYLTNALSLAKMYAVSNDKCSIVQGIVAGVELRNSSQYKKNNGIYVCSNESDILIRFIIQLPIQTSAENAITTLLNRIVSRRQQIRDKYQQRMLRLTSRVDSEISAMVGTIDKINFEILFDMSDISDMSDKVFNLLHIVCRFTAQGSSDICEGVLEITLANYPAEAPHIRLLKPYVINEHIGNSGSICLDTIAPANWVPTSHLEPLIASVVSILNESISIDKTRAYGNIDNSITEFKRIVIANNWVF